MSATVNPPAQQPLKAALQAYIDRMNAGDAAGLIALFAADAIIEDPVGSAPKRGAEIAAWFHKAVEMRTSLELAAPIRGSHGNAAAMAFVVSTYFDGVLVQVNSLDTMEFDAAGKITRLRGYWGPDDQVAG